MRAPTLDGTSDEWRTARSQFAPVARSPSDPYDRRACALHGRDRFPDARIKEFASLADNELEAAIENTREVRSTLERRLRQGGAVWRRLELALFSCDHEWRRIAAGLNRLAGTVECGGLVKLALGHYVAYLRSREFVLRELLNAR